MINENFAGLIELDKYLVARRQVSDFEKKLHLRETNYKCPLCGKDLANQKQKKSNALFEIAHIYPNSPTQEQYNNLRDVERLGDNCEDFENKIALCKDCHNTQDFHTSKEEYLRLLNIKKLFLERTALNDVTIELSLEQEIAEVVRNLTNLQEDEFNTLNYSPVKLSNKFTDNEILLKNKISMYVTSYYTYIREIFKNIEGKSNFNFEVLSLQVKAAFKKMENISGNKEDIFNQLTNWILAKTSSSSINACEAITSFFVQNCEVFNEITQ